MLVEIACVEVDEARAIQGGPTSDGVAEATRIPQC